MGAIAKTVGKISGQVIPFVGPAIAGIEAISGLIGSRKTPGLNTTGFKPNAGYTQPLAQFGGAMLPMAQQGFQTAFNYFSPLAQGNQQALATATASGAADTARQVQQQTDRFSRGMNRSGAMASLVGELPFRQQQAGLERRIGAKQAAAEQLGTLANQAGGLGTNVFGGLLGNELNAARVGVEGGYLDLARQRSDRELGGGIFDVLTGPMGGLDKNSPLGKLGGWLGGMGGYKTPGGSVPISSKPNYGMGGGLF